MKRILKYLRGTTDYALCYSAGKITHQLQVYADADYGGDLNDRRSRTGVTAILNGAPVMWICRKQKCVATSTTESEYVAASTTSKEAVWIRRLLNDLGKLHPGPTPLFNDNQSAIRLVRNPEYHKLTKHIDLHYLCVRIYQEDGRVDVS